MLFFATIIHAQPKTLQQAEEEALTNNLSLLAQRYEISVAEADIVTAHLLPTNPSLAVTGDIFPHAGTVGLEEKNYSTSIGVPIELGGKRTARVEVAENAKKASAQTFEDAVRNLLLNLRTAFYDALNAKYSLELAASNIASLDSIVALNRIRLQAKDISESELMRTEVTALAEHVQFESARVDYEKAKVNLQVAMGSKVFLPDFDITGDLTALPDSVVPSLDEAKQLAMDHRPDLQALHSQLASAEANKKLQEALSVVDLSVGGYYSNQQGQTFSGLSLSVPLPLLNRNQGEIRKADVRIEQTRTQIAALERQIDADVQTAYNEFLVRRSIVERLQNEIISRSGSVRQIVEYAYKKGGTSILDFLDAQRTFNETMKSYYDALTTLHKRAFALRAAIGQ